MFYICCSGLWGCPGGGGGGHGAAAILPPAFSLRFLRLRGAGPMGGKIYRCYDVKKIRTLLLNCRFCIV